MGKQTEAAMFARPSCTNEVTAHVVRTLAMTPAAEEFLGDLADKTGLSEGEVLRRSLAIFQAAIDAKQHDKHVGVASTPDALDIEFVGF
jgi:hypothetical protein